MNSDPPPGQSAPGQSAPGQSAPVGRRGTGRFHGRIEVPTVEGFRAVAVLLVVAIHCMVLSAPMAGGGPPGLWAVRGAWLVPDVLFVLSGFCIFLPLAAAGPERRPDWRSYAVRRICRIVPAYWLAVIVTALYVGPLSWRAGHGAHVVGFWELVIHLGFLHNVVYGVGGLMGFGINVSLWTLTSEVLFYAALPFVARWFMRHPWSGTAAALAISACWRVLARHPEGWLGPHALGWIAGTRSAASSAASSLETQFPGFVIHFALGMVGAMAFLAIRRRMEEDPAWARRARIVSGAAFVWGLLTLVAWMRAADSVHLNLDLAQVDRIRFVWNVFPAASFAVCLVASAFAPPWTTRLLTNRPVRWVGETTYGAYLFHMLVADFMARWWRQGGHAPMSFGVLGALVAVESVLIGRVSFLVVEEPIRELGRQLTSQEVRRIHAAGSWVRVLRPAWSRGAAETVPVPSPVFAR